MAKQSRILGAFNQGTTPVIVVINQAKTPLGVDLDKLIIALQKMVDVDFAPVWATPCKLVKSTGFIKGAWAIVFLDDADEPGALAYHDLTPEGLPLSKVFVKTTIEAGDKVSVSTSHELQEMLVDPAINMACVGNDGGSMLAYEVSDPVEELAYNVNGIPMSDFVHPAYFEGFRKKNSVQFDHLKKINRPFQILSGGYQSVFENGQWTEIFGSKSKKARFKKEDRRGHRSQSRGTKLKKSSSKPPRHK